MKNKKLRKLISGTDLKVKICDSKKEIFYTKSLALARLNQIKNTVGDNKKPIRTYLCDCGFWHLTSKELGKFKEI